MYFLSMNEPLSKNDPALVADLAIAGRLHGTGKLALRFGYESSIGDN